MKFTLSLSLRTILFVSSNSSLLILRNLFFQSNSVESRFRFVKTKDLLVVNLLSIPRADFEALIINILELIFFF